MVIQAFPAAKLGALLLKQISKPIANLIKERAKGHPFFRTYVCMPPAHFYNWCEVKTKMWLLKVGKPVAVPPLNEAMAIELGANILGEAFIFVIAAAVLYMEYARQVRKEERKEESRKEELSTLNYTIQELYFQMERQDAQIRELHRYINDLEGKVVHKPWSPIIGKSSSSPPPPPTPASIPASTAQVTTKPLLGEQSVVYIKPEEISLQHSEQNDLEEISSGSPTNKHHSHLPHHHIDVIPLHLEHINKVVADNPGAVITALAYLTNDIFNLKNKYYTEVHLQSQN